MKLDRTLNLACRLLLCACLVSLTAACGSATRTLPAPQPVQEAVQPVVAAAPQVEPAASPARQVATPPFRDSAAPLVTWDDVSANLEWFFVNPGDYNQDGLVTVSDFTPLGQNFNAAGPFAPESALSVVDGNSDGYITVSDITAIGQNFGNSVVRYEAYASSSSADYPTGNTAVNGAGATLIGTATLAANQLTAGQRRHFTLHLDAPPASGFCWVRPVSSADQPGTPSQLLSFGSPGGNVLPNAVLTATPLSGPVPLTVSFDAGASTDSDGQIVQYSWDFDGDQVADLSGTASTVQYTYTSQGFYTARVWVLDDAGGEDAEAAQIIAGSSTEQPPVANLIVIPESAVPGDTVVLHSFGSFDPDGGTLHYAFDPEGDGTYRPPDTDISLNWTYTELGSFHPGLRVIDDEGEFADTSGDLTVSLGTLETHVLDQHVGDVPAGLNVGLVSAGGKPAAAWFDPTADFGYGLRWCSATDASGAAWQDQRALGQATGSLSLGLAGGNPCIAYVKDYTIRYTRADDADGDGDWSNDRLIIDPALVSDTGLVTLPSLALIENRPTVVCNNADALFGGDLVYIEANNTTGSSWPAVPRKIANNDNYVAFISCLAQVNGKPAILLAGGFLGDTSIMYMRSYDTQGISWTLVPQELTPSGGYVIGNSCLEIISSYPAGAWHNRTAGRIEYARAGDQDGAAWADRVIVAQTGDTQADLDLKVINHLPWIAFNNPGSGLYISVALDNYGTEWNEPVLVEAGSATGKSVKLLELDGRGALAYYNRDQGTIIFAVYRP